LSVQALDLEPDKTLVSCPEPDKTLMSCPEPDKTLGKTKDTTQDPTTPDIGTTR